MKGCMTCIKYAFFFFNFLFWVLGALALGVGIWAATDNKFEQTIEDVLSLDDNLHLSTLKQVTEIERIENWEQSIWGRDDIINSIDMNTIEKCMFLKRSQYGTGGLRNEVLCSTDKLRI